VYPLFESIGLIDVQTRAHLASARVFPEGTFVDSQRSLFDIHVPAHRRGERTLEATPIGFTADLDETSKG
jgi:hypothetical protein